VAALKTPESSEWMKLVWLRRKLSLEAAGLRHRRTEDSLLPKYSHMLCMEIMDLYGKAEEQKQNRRWKWKTWLPGFCWWIM